MNRTSGTAKRLLGRSEGIATKLKYGAPLTGSASGVKSISLKDAGEVLTQGIVTLGKKGLQADPASLAMALPLGKVLKARNALALGGKITKAVALDERLAAKAAGKAFGTSLAERKAAGGGPIFKSIANEGLVRRGNSESVFPRLPSMGGIPKATRTFDKYADPLLEGAGRFKATRAIKGATAKRGIKVTEQGASKMARLLEERAKRRGR